MKRKMEEKLIEWKLNKNRKPLIVNGARQVGKTYLLREFGKKQYKNVVYINFENNRTVASFFDTDLSTERLIKYLEAETNQRILPEETLIIFDEIQACERAVTSLKYFCEDAPQYHIVAAGSLLGVAINRKITSFPVGKVEIFQLHPLDFEEFLLAKNEMFLIEQIKNCYERMEAMAEGLHQKAMELYREYLIVGGMPAAVMAYLEANSFIEPSNIKLGIIDNYVADMAKYATNSDAVKIRACYNSIPAQLAKDNKKFQYKVVQKGGSATIFGASLDWLKQSGVILECHRVEQGIEPLVAYEDQSAFKIYMADVGLLVEKSGMSISTILSGEPNIFMGAVTENYVAQQLAAKGYTLYYWSVASSQAEMDFVHQKENEIMAIEVKKGEHVRSRSLNVFCNKFTSTAVRISGKNFGISNGIKSVPLYSVFMI